jgi:hypothetical protein
MNTTPVFDVRVTDDLRKLLDLPADMERIRVSVVADLLTFERADGTLVHLTDKEIEARAPEFCANMLSWEAKAPPADTILNREALHIAAATCVRDGTQSPKPFLSVDDELVIPFKTEGGVIAVTILSEDAVRRLVPELLPLHAHLLAAKRTRFESYKSAIERHFMPVADLVTIQKMFRETREQSTKEYEEFDGPPGERVVRLGQGAGPAKG